MQLAGRRLVPKHSTGCNWQNTNLHTEQSKHTRNAHSDRTRKLLQQTLTTTEVTQALSFACKLKGQLSKPRSFTF